MKVIASVANETIKREAKLLTPKGRREAGEFLVEGFHLVKEAALSGRLKRVYALPSVISPTGIARTEVTPAVLKKLCETQNPEGIVGVASVAKPLPLGKRVLILDGVQDPGNVGTLLRSALAFGIDTVVLGNGTPDATSGKVVRASQGALFHLNVISVSAFDTCQKALDDGLLVLGAEAHGGSEPSTLVSKKGFALVLGSEAHGISDEVERLLSGRITISMAPSLESLNVAVAGSILLYLLSR